MFALINRHWIENWPGATVFIWAFDFMILLATWTLNTEKTMHTFSDILITLSFCCVELNVNVWYGWYRVIQLKCQLLLPWCYWLADWSINRWHEWSPGVQSITFLYFKKQRESHYFSYFLFVASICDLAIIYIWSPLQVIAFWIRNHFNSYQRH